MSKADKAKPDSLSPRAEYLIERHGSVWLIWLLFVYLKWTRSAESLLRGELANNDDYMRMVEIRDWLGGQNWFDMHQYRLNPVDPLYSHWSRLSDVLIGGPIKILTPLLGQAKAELVTVIAYPSIMLIIYLYLVTALSGKLFKSRATPVVSAAILILSFGVFTQFGMGRIDHHSLQIVMALATCWFIITSLNKPKNMIYAGILCGVGLYVGIESAPYVAAACIAVVLVWVFAENMAAQKLRYFSLAMAATTVICLLISAPPTRWFTPSCDALSVVYTQLTLAVALIMWGLSLASNRIKTPIGRFVLAGVFGSLALLVTVVLYPHCMEGPYANLDPRLVEIWLSNVAEAGNFIQFLADGIASGVAAIFLPVLAIAGYFWVAKTEDKSLALIERTMFIFVVLTLIAGLLQTRLMFVSNALAIPLAASVVLRLLSWAGKFKPRAKMVLIRSAIIIALSPVTLPILISMVAPSDDANEAAANNNTQKSGLEAPECFSQTVLGKLTALPAGTALTQIDLGAPILKFTDLSVTSAPYHRNTSGILAALDMFIEDEATAKRAVAKMRADYVIACRDSNETKMMLGYGPDGMLAKLIAGEVPSWLEKVKLDTEGVLLVYRVKPDQS
ncbi:MAG: hypothetical protein L3J65_11905 [Robiginitomaculum sp.]|nr:hypothetical protein [Robiginitomaculum sp.]